MPFFIGINLNISLEGRRENSNGNKLLDASLHMWGQSLAVHV